MLPVEAGHVGADNVGVILAEEPDKAPSDEVWLIVDVGTNGELLLGNREQLFRRPARPVRPSRARRFATACARRPAPSSGCASTPTRWTSASRLSAATSGAMRGVQNRMETAR